MAFDGSHAVLLAARFCKQFPLFGWREEALPSIGQRRDKFSFRVDLANLAQEGCGEMLMTLFPAQLSFLDFSKDTSATLYKLKALLVTLKHPYLLPVVEIYYSREKKGLLVVQPFVESGSLKDRIHRANPTRPYDEKYRLYHASPLPVKEIGRFGRQILEALQALRSKGIVCDHLSSANVVIDQGNARIAEIYSPLLAIDRHKTSRDLTVPLESKVDVDLLLFGHIIYEMATGMELPTPVPEDSVLDLMPPDVAEVLEFIFYPASSKKSPEETASSVDDDVVSTYSEGSGDSGGNNNNNNNNSSSAKDGFLVDLEELLACPLFADADVPAIDSLFSGFRLDSGMKSTVRNSMRINASRNQAYVVHYKEKMALVRARQRAERRVYDEKDKQDKRAQHQLATSRGIPSASDRGTLSRRKSYRANSFKTPLRRQGSSSASSTVATA